MAALITLKVYFMHRNCIFIYTFFKKYGTMEKVSL